MLDLDSFLVSLYVLVDDWWKLQRSSEPPRAGRPALLTDPEVITLAILAQWPRFRSERDFWRFAQAHLRPYFPKLCSQSQLNRRVRSWLQPYVMLGRYWRAYTDLPPPKELQKLLERLFGGEGVYLYVH
jgi:hypothetical protein